MSPYEKFVADIATANGNIIIIFFAALGIVAGYESLNWVNEKYRERTRVLYLAWWLLVFLLFYFLKIE